MRILYVSPRQCWPLLSGAKLRDYHLALALGRHAALTYLFFAEPGLPVPTRADLPFCEEIVPVPHPGRRYTAGGIIRGVFGRWPLPVVKYTSAAMSTAISRICAGHRFEIAHMDGIHLAAYGVLLRKMTKDARVIFDWHNIESEGMRRYSGNTDSHIRRIGAAFTANRLASLESMLLRAMFGHLVCSEREKRQLLSITPPGARLAVIENGVDAAYFEQSAVPYQSRNRLVFVGTMDYHANIDAIVSFTRLVWPRIRERFPRWRLSIVGANPVQAVLDLCKQPAIEVTGTVADLRPYYQGAFAAIVPLRTGMGTRLKILEAMAAGVPVVSSTIGAEGLAVIPGKHLLIADDAEDWLTALSSLTVEETWRGLVECGRSLVHSRYDWPILEERLWQTYLQWLGN
ncbi:MAG: glycosyltransferase [Acidobacteria bacterium]|nr:glycosyltransferase [Acidobacteriota bacterium]